MSQLLQVLPQPLVQLLWLLRMLLTPFSGMRWLLWLALATVVPGVLVNWQWQSPGLLVFGICLGALFAAMAVTFMPLNLLALASNKTLALATNLRAQLLLASLFTICCSAPAIGGMFAILPQQSFGASSIGAFAALSVYLQVVVLVGSYSSRVQILIPLSIIGVMILVQAFVRNFPLIAGLICTLSWILFALWWLYWRAPVLKVYSLSQQLGDWQFKGAQPQLCTNNWRWLQGPGRSLIGSLLIGASDGLRPQLLRLALMLSAYLISVGFLSWAGLGGATPVTPLNIISGKALVFLLGLILFSVSLEANQNVFMNLKRLWLVFPGDRQALLAYLERWFLAKMLWAGGLILLAFALVAVVQGEPFSSALADVKLMGFLWLTFCLNFLLVLLIYVKTQVSLQLFSGLSFLLVMSILLLAIFFSAAIAQASIWLPLGIIVSGIYLRRYLWQQWPRVNLLRPS